MAPLPQKTDGAPQFENLFSSCYHFIPREISPRTKWMLCINHYLNVVIRKILPPQGTEPHYRFG
jgi:hypothetical protein